MWKTIAAVWLVTVFFSGCRPRGRPIVVGCKDFPEQLILQQIVAQHLILNKFEVETLAPEGSNLEAHRALLDDDIDLYPEYTGTAFSLVLNHCCAANHPRKTVTQQQPPDCPDLPADLAAYAATCQRVLETVRKEYLGMDLVWLDPLGFDNSWAMVGKDSEVPCTLGEVAEPKAGTSSGYQLVAGPNFLERPDGFGALMATYPIRWVAAPVLSQQVDGVYKDLDAETQDRKPAVARLLRAGDRTHELKPGFHIVHDDRQAFLPYEACLVVRKGTLQAKAGLRGALSKLPRIDLNAMRGLNQSAAACVAGSLPRCYEDIAREWLQQHRKP